jgi:hypothetical protein
MVAGAIGDDVTTTDNKGRDRLNIHLKDGGSFRRTVRIKELVQAKLATASQYMLKHN